MFKTTILLDSDDTIMDVTQCEFMYTMTSSNIVVISDDMLRKINITKLNPSLLIIIGRHSPLSMKCEIKYFDSVRLCIGFLSEYHSESIWWIICGNAMMTEMIWNGVINDIHVIKLMISMEHEIAMNHRKEKYDYTAIDDYSCQFSRHSAYAIMDYNRRATHTRYSRCNEEENELLRAMRSIISDGNYRDNRTGVATYSTFGKSFEYRMIERVDASTGKSLYRFPLLTTKRMFVRGVFAELKWFLSGQTDSKILENQGINIWKGNSSREYLDSYGLYEYAEGKCGPIYGHQWRSWGAEYDQNRKDHIGSGHDQVAQCINSLKFDPFSRRHIISGWNVSQLENMALPPCHVIYQFYVHEKKGQRYLSLSMYQRSGDTFLGVPFNICSMGMLLLLMSHQVGYKPYKIVHMIGDMHIYENHLDAVQKQVKRTPNMFPFIGISAPVKDNIEDYEFSEVIIDGYVHHNTIKADMVA